MSSDYQQGNFFYRHMLKQNVKYNRKLSKLNVNVFVYEENKKLNSHRQS